MTNDVINNWITNRYDLHEQNMSTEKVKHLKIDDNQKLEENVKDSS